MDNSIPQSFPAKVEEAYISFMGDINAFKPKDQFKVNMQED